jgi:Integrase core domain
LFPTNKGREPFVTWAIDCITEMHPPAPCGGTTIVTAIDAWSKWIEFRIVNPRDSREMARFLWEEIICRYGVPYAIRRDQGREFEGDFRNLCNQLGIRLQTISTLHPRANGIVERYNRELKTGIRKLLALCSGAQWF